MERKLRDILAQYRAALEEYGSGKRELALQTAYEVGRAAVEGRVGILDLVTLHERAVGQLVEKASTSRDAKRIAKIGDKILQESLSSYELIFRGFQDAVDSLNRGTEELSLANERLKWEIAERKLAETALRQANQALEVEILERKKVEKEAMEIAQREQRRFGAELHDGLCQKLVGTSMLIQGLVRNAKRGGSLDLSEIVRIASLVEEAAQQARSMAHGFFPVELQADALMVSLSELARRARENFSIACEFRCPVAILIEDNNIATHLYQIAQEAVNNARKHGDASHVEVSLFMKDGKIHLHVLDDGRGLNHEGKDSVGGIGMQIMKYRARMIDAELQLQAALPRGTLLTCVIKAPLFPANLKGRCSPQEPSLESGL